MNLTNLIRKGHLLPVTTPDRHGIPMLTGWKRKPSSRKHGSWTLKKPTVWIDRLAVMKGKALLPGAQLVKEENDRRVLTDALSPIACDRFTNGELVTAARCYVRAPGARCALPSVADPNAIQVPDGWPMESVLWNPGDRTNDLAKAGALYLAEADRLKRAEKYDEAAEVEKLATGCAGLIDAIYGV